MRNWCLSSEPISPLICPLSASILVITAVSLFCGNMLRYTCAIAKSGEIRTSLTEMSTPERFLAYLRKISLRSFWINLAILCCLVVSILFKK